MAIEALRIKFKGEFEQLESLVNFTLVELQRPAHNFKQEYNVLFYLGVLAHWVKAVKTSQSIILLCENGLSTDAAGLVRTLVETTISCKYLCAKDQNERSVWYASYGAIERKRFHGTLQKGRYTAIRNQIDPETEKSLQEFFEITTRRRNSTASLRKRLKMEAGLFLSRFGFRMSWWPWAQTWSGKTVPKMAKEVGLPAFYDFPYQLASPIVHATDSTNHIDLLDPEKADPSKGIHFNIAPDEKHADFALVTSALALDELLRQIYVVLQLPRQDELAKLSAHLRAKIKTI